MNIVLWYVLEFERQMIDLSSPQIQLIAELLSPIETTDHFGLKKENGDSSKNLQD